MRKLKGIIVSNKMLKTAVVRVDRLKKHPKYKKYFKISKRLKAHINSGEYNTGDEVIVQEMRPLSKDKKWKIIELVKKHNPEESLEKSADKK